MDLNGDSRNDDLRKTLGEVYTGLDPDRAVSFGAHLGQGHGWSLNPPYAAGKEFYLGTEIAAVLAKRDFTTDELLGPSGDVLQIDFKTQGGRRTVMIGPMGEGARAAGVPGEFFLLDLRPGPEASSGMIAIDRTDIADATALFGQPLMLSQNGDRQWTSGDDRAYRIVSLTSKVPLTQDHLAPINGSPLLVTRDVGGVQLPFRSLDMGPIPVLAFANSGLGTFIYDVEPPFGPPMTVQLLPFGPNQLGFSSSISSDVEMEFVDARALSGWVLEKGAAVPDLPYLAKEHPLNAGQGGTVSRMGMLVELDK